METLQLIGFSGLSYVNLNSISANQKEQNYLIGSLLLSTGFLVYFLTSVAIMALVEAKPSAASRFLLINHWCKNDLRGNSNISLPHTDKTQG